VSVTIPAAKTEGLLEARGSRAALTGFFLSGMLFAFLGAILPAWGYHRTELYTRVGNYFIAFNIGLFLANRLSAWLLPRKGIRWCLRLACGLACATLLAWAYPGMDNFKWQLIGLLVLGASTGLLHGAIFQAITPIYRHDPAATGNLAGIFFGAGSFFMALLVAGTYYVYTTQAILMLIAAIPGLFGIWYSGGRYDVTVQPMPKLTDTIKDLRSPMAIQFGLVLMLQCANEWSVGGWLPLFLTQRLGVSPSSSLLFLALYYGALVVGRILAQAVLPWIRHGKVLMIACIAATLGIVILTSTDNRFGVFSGILFIGVGFAPVYPLVAERIGNRFPYYDPALYHGIFTVAFAGALLATGAQGYLASVLGIRSVLMVPLAGMVLMALLLVAIWVEVKLSSFNQKS
jgi:fucose permease